MYNYKLTFKYEDTEGYDREEELILSHEHKYNRLEIEDMVTRAMEVIEYDCVWDLITELRIHLKWCYGFVNLPIEKTYEVNYKR